MVLESEMVAGHHVAGFAVWRLRAWPVILPVFYHNVTVDQSPSVICVGLGHLDSHMPPKLGQKEQRF